MRTSFILIYKHFFLFAHFFLANCITKYNNFFLSFFCTFLWLTLPLYRAVFPPPQPSFLSHVCVKTTCDLVNLQLTDTFLSLFCLACCLSFFLSFVLGCVSVYLHFCLLLLLFYNNHECCLSSALHTSSDRVQNTLFFLISLSLIQMPSINRS